MNISLDTNAKFLRLMVDGKEVSMSNTLQLNGDVFFSIRSIVDAIGYNISIENDVIYLKKIEGDEPDDSITEEPVQNAVYETKVLYGVNFRNQPNSDTSHIYKMISKGEMIHVIKEMDANWLQIQTQDKVVGYISSNTKYTDYASKGKNEKQADDIIAYGETFLKAPYVFGAAIGQVDDQGNRVFDCSSFTKTLFKDVLNITISRVSYNQAKEGTEVARQNLQKGDLMFFSSAARGLDIGHVGIYAGNGKILHTYNKTYGVRYSDFTGQWSDRFVTARRFISQ